MGKPGYSIQSLSGLLKVVEEARFLIESFIRRWNPWQLQQMRLNLLSKEKHYTTFRKNRSSTMRLF